MLKIKRLFLYVDCKKQYVPNPRTQSKPLCFPTGQGTIPAQTERSWTHSAFVWNITELTRSDRTIIQAGERVQPPPESSQARWVTATRFYCRLHVFCANNRFMSSTEQHCLKSEKKKTKHLTDCGADMLMRWGKQSQGWCCSIEKSYRCQSQCHGI